MTAAAFCARASNEEPCVRCGEPTLPICEDCADPPPDTKRTPELLTDDRILRELPELARRLGEDVCFGVDFYTRDSRWNVWLSEHRVIKCLFGASGGAYVGHLADAYSEAERKFLAKRTAYYQASRDANPAGDTDAHELAPTEST